mmetsp:Transcript_8588/g.9752  ORF Transcript_8588/g.9752 Transcript_8588/m.9752 type:complete len:149 (+) Transcript_8588:19-465(+)
MEDKENLIRIDSSHRDSEFFMWQSEDIDSDDPHESPTEKHSIYSFKSNPSLLMSNKGHTKRCDLANFRNTKSMRDEDRKNLKNKLRKGIKSASIDQGFEVHLKHDIHNFNKELKKHLLSKRCESNDCEVLSKPRKSNKTQLTCLPKNQ